jgi:long-chain fatty acid transport protein
VRTQSLVSFGMAQAGITTGAGGIAAMIANPATLSASSGRLLESGTAAVMTGGRFRDIEASTVSGAPIGGGNGSGEHVPGVLPSIYVAGDLADGLRAGLAVTALYGLGTHYDATWSGRYHAIDSELISVVVQPTLSWQATPWLAVGGGPQIQYIRSRSTVAIDFGTIDAVAAGGAFGGVPGASDGRAKVTLDGFGVGFALGALLTPAPGTRLGIGYRSAIDQSLDGDAEFGLGGPVGAGLAALTGAFSNTGASATVKLPDSLYLGIQQQLGAGVTVHADLHWMGWGRIDQLVTRFDNPAQATDVTRLPWDDSIYVAVGASWDVDERLTLRAGAAYDQGPARNGGATAAIPDGNSVWAATGLSYRMTDTIVLDAALGVLFTESVTVTARTTDPGGTFRGDFSGRYEEGRALFGGLGVRFAF